MFARSRQFRSAPRILLAAALIMLAGCASTTPIGELLNDPGRYDGETVRIEGEVQEAVGGLGLGAYQVRDDTGTITVVSEQAGAPRTGARVEVEGIFESLFTLGSESLAVLRERDRDLP